MEQSLWGNLYFFLFDGDNYSSEEWEDTLESQENHLKTIKSFNSYLKDDGYKISYKSDPDRSLSLAIYLQPLLKNLQTDTSNLEDLLKGEGGMDHLLDNLKSLQENIDNFGFIADESKVILESVCKCILSELGESYKKNENFDSLFNKAISILKLKKETNEKILEFPEDSVNIWAIFSALKEIQKNIRELRGQEGRKSHGKEKGFNPDKFEERHAQLLANSTITLCTFLFETYLYHKNLKNKKE